MNASPESGPTADTTTPAAEVKPPTPHLFVSILAGGGKSFESHVASREFLRTACYEEKISLSISRNAGTGVDRARNMEVAKFLAVKPHATHMLFLDNDIAFKPEWVIQMLRTNLPICGAAYPRKDLNYEQIHAAVLKGVKPEDLPLYENTFIVNGFRGEGYTNEFGFFAEVDELGTGFLMIRRDVIEDYIRIYKEDLAYVTDYEPRDTIQHTVFACMRDPNCEIEVAKKALTEAAKLPRGKARDKVLSAVADRYTAAVANLEKGAAGRYLTEDYSFCRKSATIGHKTYCFLEAAVEHIGAHVHRGSIKKFINMEAKETVEVAV